MAESETADEKWIGVRRIRCERNGVVTDQPSVFEQEGQKHPIVAHLLEHNPRVLGRVLSTCDHLKAINSKYIATLLSTKCVREQVRSSPRKPSIVEARKNQEKTILNNARALQTDDVLSKEDEVFLIDIMEDDGDWKEKNRACTDSHATTTTQSRPLKKNRRKIKGGAIPKSDRDDLLQWLILEFDLEWDTFVYSRLSGSQKQLLAGSIGNDYPYHLSRIDSDEPGCRVKESYIYQASIWLVGRHKCVLGTYHSAELAAMAYNRGMIARRTIGIKLLEECDLRRRVKSRKADYMEMKRSVVVQGLSPHDAAETANAAGLRAFQRSKPHTFLTSDKVLYPDLNFIGKQSDCAAQRHRSILPFETQLTKENQRAMACDVMLRALYNSLSEKDMTEHETNELEQVLSSLNVLAHDTDGNVDGATDLDRRIRALETRVAVTSERVLVQANRLMHAVGTEMSGEEDTTTRWFH